MVLLFHLLVRPYLFSCSFFFSRSCCETRPRKSVLGWFSISHALVRLLFSRPFFLTKSVAKVGAGSPLQVVLLFHLLVRPFLFFGPFPDCVAKLDAGSPLSGGALFFTHSPVRFFLVPFAFEVRGERGTGKSAPGGPPEPTRPSVFVFLFLPRFLFKAVLRNGPRKSGVGGPLSSLHHSSSTTLRLCLFFPCPFFLFEI